MPWNDDQGPKNPWGGSEPGRSNNPWGGGGRGSGGNGGNGRGGPPQDFDELFRRAQENFKNIMPGDAGLGHAALILGAVALILWCLSGFYFVQPNENAVVMTFGRFSKTEEVSGLKYALPWPIQQVVKVDTTTERRIEVGYRQNGSSSQGGVDSTDESLMLTGDENIIDIDFVVTWRVGKARDYLFEIRNPEDTIKLVAESAMREIIGRTKITAALTEARGQIQADAKSNMQRVLDEYQSGVVVNNVQLLKVDPPAEVIDAFNDVQNARTEAERMQNEATAYRNDIIPRARGQVQQLLAEADAYRQEVIAKAKGDSERFISVYESYARAKDVTAERLYLDAIEEILSNANTVLMDGPGANNALPFLNIGKRNMSDSVLPTPVSGGQ